MFLLSSVLEVFLHLDRVLGDVILRFGVWSYALLFVVIFCETGLVITPFLPGDSLLFAAGTFAALGSFQIFWLFLLLVIAAILGDTVNYWIGRSCGASFTWIRPEYLEKTRSFYERYGGKTIILSRFVPIVRTFAPFVAGIGQMRYSTFVAYNIIGAVVWVGLFTLGGYFFGNLPVIRKHFTIAILGIIFLSILPGAIEIIRARYIGSRSRV